MFCLNNIFYVKHFFHFRAKEGAGQYLFYEKRVKSFVLFRQKNSLQIKLYVLISQRQMITPCPVNGHCDLHRVWGGLLQEMKGDQS
jgi:hypothetical protein